MEWEDHKGNHQKHKTCLNKGRSPIAQCRDGHSDEHVAQRSKQARRWPPVTPVTMWLMALKHTGTSGAATDGDAQKLTETTHTLQTSTTPHWERGRDKRCPHWKKNEREQMFNLHLERLKVHMHYKRIRAWNRITNPSSTSFKVALPLQESSRLLYFQLYISLHKQPSAPPVQMIM